MQELKTILQKHQSEFNKIVQFDPKKDKVCGIDLSSGNSLLTEADVMDTVKFSQILDLELKRTGSKYAVGGYGENRTLYSRSKLFDVNEPRTLHLGIDIWGPSGTAVYAPLGGVVHSYAFNNDFGDYGATIILQHQLETKVFHTLYGHLSQADLLRLQEGKYIIRGDKVGHFGEPKENGNWPSHLHFQVIDDMRLQKGDYPGVCSQSESIKYLSNCPDADLILQMKKYIHSTI